MVIPIIVEQHPSGTFGKPLYICMLTILPIVALLVFGALKYRTIKVIQNLIDEDDFVANETVKDVKIRARVILGKSAVCILSIIIYCTQFVSSILSNSSNSPDLMKIDSVHTQ